MNKRRMSTLFYLNIVLGVPIRCSMTGKKNERHTDWEKISNFLFADIKIR